jgi:hypothetical protein
MLVRTVFRKKIQLVAMQGIFMRQGITKYLFPIRKSRLLGFSTSLTQFFALRFSPLAWSALVLLLLRERFCAVRFSERFFVAPF